MRHHRQRPKKRNTGTESSGTCSRCKEAPMSKLHKNSSNRMAKTVSAATLEEDVEECKVGSTNTGCITGVNWNGLTGTDFHIKRGELER